MPLGPTSSHSSLEPDSRLWIMIMHFSQLVTCGMIPLFGLILPLILWQIKRTEMPEIEEHGKMIVNWQISLLIYMAVSGVLCLALIGIPALLVLMILSIVFPILGGIRAYNGMMWPYPLTIKFLK